MKMGAEYQLNESMFNMILILIDSFVSHSLLWLSLSLDLWIQSLTTQHSSDMPWYLYGFSSLNSFNNLLLMF